MSDDSPVPERYQPEPRKCDDKEWLREQYWGEMLNQAEIAEKCELSASRVGHRLRDMGIPTRPAGYSRSNGTSPFAGFYGGGESIPGHEPSATEYDPELASDFKHQWRDFAAGGADD